MSPSLPIIAIVGRTNVGKSTLFNYLTKTRLSLVANLHGLTRDYLSAQGRVGNLPYLVLDTGGLGATKDAIQKLVVNQTHQAIQTANHLLWVVDARSGLTHDEETIATFLRTLNKPITLILNKSEGLASHMISSEFFSLGFGPGHAISAIHGKGIEDLMANLLPSLAQIALPTVETLSAPIIKITFVGKPNAGKSTLVNWFLGKERMLVSHQPGTTRDSISIPFRYQGKAYCLIDTAGIRRKAKITDAIEKFSAIKSLESITACHVAILVIDAQTSMTEQDLRLLSFILDSGKAFIIAINKWDSITPESRAGVQSNLDRHLGFVRFAPIHFISALTGYGVLKLFPLIDQAYAHAYQPMLSSQLTRLLEQALTTHPPPPVGGRHIKLRYAHPGGYNPPTIIIHGTRTRFLPHSYRRYLENYYRRALGHLTIPIRVELKDKDPAH